MNTCIGTVDEPGVILCTYTYVYKTTKSLTHPAGSIETLSVKRCICRGVDVLKITFCDIEDYFYKGNA